MDISQFQNPFRPGAGHMPPYLAGRTDEISEFQKLLRQDVILENLVLTGLRGVGKTVLLDTLKPVAIKDGWLWVGTDLSESSTVSEESICVRMMADLAVVTSSMTLSERNESRIGFHNTKTVEEKLNYHTLVQLYQSTPGLAADRIRSILEIVWSVVERDGRKGIIFAYDEAQNLADHARKDEFPLSLLLDVFQSLQKRGVRFMLLLTGLPTLFPKLVEARTFAERMFHVLFLDRLDNVATREAIVKPTDQPDCPFTLNDPQVETISATSAGYPYFIQFVCREVFDIWHQKLLNDELPTVDMREIVRKLDADFFAGRWARATDRQRELLSVIAHLPNADQEFTIQEIVEASQEDTEKPFTASHVNQMLATLSNSGLVYKNRHGKYSFAVPLLGKFILRQESPP